MRVIIAGGTGYVGRHLSAAVLSEGHAVTVLTRGVSREAANARPEFLHWEPASADRGWVAALDGADAVVNLAGANIGKGRWTRRRRERLRRSRLDATAALAAAIRDLPRDRRPRTLVSASGIDVYGDRDDEQVDETAEAGTGFLAGLCVDWEAEARRAEDSGVRTVLMRTGIVLSGDSPTLRLMALPFRIGVGGPLGSGRQWLAWIHVEDVVGLYRRALDDSGICGPVNAVAPGAVRQRDFAALIGRVLHRPARARVPSPILRIALGMQADLLVHGRHALPSVASARGYRFVYPDIEQALREALRRPPTGRA